MFTFVIEVCFMIKTFYSFILYKIFISNCKLGLWSQENDTHVIVLGLWSHENDILGLWSHENDILGLWSKALAGKLLYACIRNLK